MLANQYQIITGILLILFCLVRLPFMIKYQQHYQPKSGTTLATSQKQTDFVLVFSMAVCWVMIPAAWCFKLFTVGDFYLHDSVRWLGAIIYLAGIVLMVLANLHLKDNWSAIMEIKRDHQLITRGIYKYVRHPMYTSFYLQVFGVGIVTANLLVALLAIVSWQIAYSYRIEREESLLLNEFGSTYLEYMKHTGRLLPKFRWVKK